MTGGTQVHLGAGTAGAGPGAAPDGGSPGRTTPSRSVHSVLIEAATAGPGPASSAGAPARSAGPSPSPCTPPCLQVRAPPGAGRSPRAGEPAAGRAEGSA